MLWHELSSPQIGALNRDIPIVIPLASCEQHGRHLPVFVDTFQLQEVMQHLEANAGDRIVCAPTLWLGASHHHMDFPGAISLPPKLYSEVIQQITLCFLNHGFRRLLFLNGHGGNVIPANHAITDLITSNDLADAACIALTSWWRVTAHVLDPKAHNMETPVVTHACEYETSFMLAIREDLVDISKISADHVEKVRTWVGNPRYTGKVEGFHRFHRWTSTGHMGNPAAATKEKGLSMLEQVTGALVEFVDDFAKWPVMDPLR